MKLNTGTVEAWGNQGRFKEVVCHKERFTKQEEGKCCWIMSGGAENKGNGEY